jgi:ABC-2 type transport system permease protein
MSLGLRASVRAALAAACAVGRTKIQTTGLFFYALIWLSFPVFNLFLVALIYRGNAQLQNYAIVAGAGMAMLFGMQFNACEILDGERQRGTLGNLFLAPVPRYAWLAGFQLYAILEALTAAVITLTGGVLAFGLHLRIDVLALLLVFTLFVCCMWGFSMIVGAIGVAIRDANMLSNLLFTPVALLAGTMFPLAVMPGWLRIPAHALPFSYAIQGLVDATTRDQLQVWDTLLPLAGFAVALPLLGMFAFRRIERLTRRQGSLELV